MPALEKWSGFVVAATLIAIGLMGIYESYFEKEEEASEHVQEEQQGIELALAGKTHALQCSTPLHVASHACTAIRSTVPMHAARKRTVWPQMLGLSRTEQSLFWWPQKANVQSVVLCSCCPSVQVLVPRQGRLVSRLPLQPTLLALCTVYNPTHSS